jgi:hypothetical protein
MWSSAAWNNFHRNPPTRPAAITLQGGSISSLRDRHLYSDHFVSLLRSESRWVPQTDVRKLSDMLELVGTGVAACSLCNGRKTLSSPHIGETTGIVVRVESGCECRKAVNFYSHWHDEKQVPKRYRCVSWAKLAPIPPGDEMSLSVARQQTIIDFIKARPNDSFLFYGKSSSGKTHLSYALHRRILADWAKRTVDDDNLIYCPVLRANVTVLLKQHAEWATKSRGENTPRPDITVGRIRDIINSGARPVLILDELDKLGNPTEFKLTTLLAIMDAAYNANGQIIATANRGPDWMVNEWGEDFGGPIVRRCGAGTYGHTVPFVEKS